MVLLHEDEFKARLTSVRLAILPTPSPSAMESNTITICDQTKRILEVHSHGLDFVLKSRARLYWNEGSFKVDWGSIDCLSEDEIREWGNTVSYIACSLRYVKSSMNLWTSLIS